MKKIAIIIGLVLSLSGSVFSYYIEEPIIAVICISMSLLCVEFMSRLYRKNVIEPNLQAAKSLPPLKGGLLFIAYLGGALIFFGVTGFLFILKYKAEADLLLACVAMAVLGFCFIYLSARTFERRSKRR